MLIKEVLGLQVDDDGQVLVLGALVLQCLDLLVEAGRFDRLALVGCRGSHVPSEPVVGGIGRGSDSGVRVTILLLIRMASSGRTGTASAESAQVVCAPIETSGGHRGLPLLSTQSQVRVGPGSA